METKGIHGNSCCNSNINPVLAPWQLCAVELQLLEADARLHPALPAGSAARRASLHIRLIRSMNFYEGWRQRYLRAHGHGVVGSLLKLLHLVGQFGCEEGALLIHRQCGLQLAVFLTAGSGGGKAEDQPLMSCKLFGRLLPCRQRCSLCFTVL